jgi:malic enzyme
MNAESATSAEHGEATGRDSKPVFALHRRGKMAITSTAPLRDSDDLSLAYTPGVAEVCTAIECAPRSSSSPNSFTTTPGPPVPSWSSPPAPPCSAWATLASVVTDELRPDHIVPSPFDPRVAPAVAEAVATAARLEGVARR